VPPTHIRELNRSNRNIYIVSTVNRISDDEVQNVVDAVTTYFMDASRFFLGTPNKTIFDCRSTVAVWPLIRLGWGPLRTSSDEHTD
jgi:hypothetical protein